MSLTVVLLMAVASVLHATWNLGAHRQRSSATFFLQLSIMGAAIGIVPAIAFELTSAPLPVPVWLLLALTGLAQGVYYFALNRGYRHGDFSVVYPLARSLPVLALAFIDLLRGRAPAPAGWLGLLLVFAGCFLAPQISLRGFSLRRYWNRATIWIGVTALSVVGYTLVDKLALELMAPGPISALRYAALEYVVVVPFLWLLQRAAARRYPDDRPPARMTLWRWPALAALFMTSAYLFVLLAYQLTPQTSYVAALRQMSLVIGTLAAIILFKEPGARLRLSATALIIAGVVTITLGG
jgi:drug/metabolite transporter (DMT)-like permease